MGYFRVLSIVILTIFLGLVGTQCASQGGLENGAGLEGATPVPGLPGGTASQGNENEDQQGDDVQSPAQFDGFEAMARFYGTDRQSLIELAAAEGFDPKNFNAQSVDDLVKFLNFIHKGVPGLYELFEGSFTQNSNFFGLVQYFYGKSQEAGYVPLSDQSILTLLAKTMKNTLLIETAWRSQVAGLAANFGFQFPVMDEAVTPIPASYTGQIDQLFGLMEPIFETAVFTDEVKTLFADLANEIYIHRHLTLNEELFGIDLEASGDIFTRATINPQQ